MQSILDKQMSSLRGTKKKKTCKKRFFFFFKNDKYFENKVKLLWWNKTFAIDYKSPEMFVSWANKGF